MAIEDIIWAKNRHMFGGMEPDEVKTLYARLKTTDENVNNLTITVEKPVDTVIADQTLCSVAGVMIRGSFEDYPKDEFSGFAVGDYSESGSYDFSVEGHTGDVLYLSAFSYSDQGVFNRNSTKYSIKLDAVGYVFGFDIDTANSDPDTRVTYPSDVDNYGWKNNAIVEDAAIKYNDWNFEPGTKFMPRPCMLGWDGTILEYLDPDDYTMNVDGAASNVSNIDCEAEAMMEWPKIYTKRWEENGIYHFRCSDYKIDDDYECWCNYDQNNQENDRFYTSIYTGGREWGNDQVVRSLLGYAGKTLGSENIHTLFSYCRRGCENGYWKAHRITDHCLIQDLLVMVCKTTKLYLLGINVFGMPDYFGASNSNWVKPIEEIPAANWGIIYINGKQYEAPYEYDADGYVKNMKVYPWGRWPYYPYEGSSTTYECSRVYYVSRSSDYYKAIYYQGLYSYSEVIYNQPSNSRPIGVVRLSYSPNATT